MPRDSFITDTQAVTTHCFKNNFGISGSYNLSPFFFAADKFWRAVGLAIRYLSSCGLTRSWHDLLSQCNCGLTLIMDCWSGFQEYYLDASSYSLSVLDALRKASCISPFFLSFLHLIPSKEGIYNQIPATPVYSGGREITENSYFICEGH